MRESWYDRYILPYVIELECGVKPVRRQRAKVVPLARGRVLELGIGSGLNMPYSIGDRQEHAIGITIAQCLPRPVRVFAGG